MKVSSNQMLSLSVLTEHINPENAACLFKVFLVVGKLHKRFNFFIHIIYAK